MKINKNNSGFVLTSALMLLLIALLIAGSFVFAARQSGPRVTAWQQYDETLLAAQTAMESIKADVYMRFKDYHEITYSWNDINWLKDHAAESSADGSLSAIAGIPGCPYDEAQIHSTVTTSDVTGSYDEQVLFVTVTVEAEWKTVTRKIRETVCYRLNKSSVFDHSYFINNYGWFSRVDMVVNGDIRSNYDVDLNSSSLILNGSSYAGGVNAVNRNPGAWNWNTYKNNSYSEYFRPAGHVDMNKNNPDSEWEYGYDPYTVSIHDNTAQLDMPYIGDLSDYKYYAQKKGGQISINGSVVADAVYDGTGPSGVEGAADEGCLVLRGTQENPIVINGPVVVDGDVIIEGYYTGQGTIYAGRNVHIIGDLTAVDPPKWEQPDTAVNFRENTLPDNLQKDFLGLCAKGSVVIGDYRSSSFASGVSAYIQPPGTSAYEVSATDADIGYVSYAENGTNYFNGDYTATYGEKCSDSNPAAGVPRRLYESSLSDGAFGALSPNGKIRTIQAMLYNNHLTVGYFDQNAMVNGGIICRDEAMILNGRLYLNWDPRVALSADFTPYLPMELKPAETIVWTELAP